VGAGEDGGVKYWEDFAAGEIIELGSCSITEVEVLAFARKYDPQPFHTDPAAARRSIFGGLIASGWHTAGVAMRLMCDGYLLESSCIGSPGIDELKFLRPVRPGEALRFRSTVLETAPSKTKPNRGTVTFRWEVLNQRGEVALSMLGKQLFLKRSA
jgi:acyl dehydratase